LLDFLSYFLHSFPDLTLYHFLRQVREGADPNTRRVSGSSDGIRLDGSSIAACVGYFLGHRKCNGGVFRG
jgi:hypothetical protein